MATRTPPSNGPPESDDERGVGIAHPTVVPVNFETDDDESRSDES